MTGQNIQQSQFQARLVTLKCIFILIPLQMMHTTVWIIKLFLTTTVHGNLGLNQILNMNHLNINHDITKKII
jgi:hypothetical protein